MYLCDLFTWSEVVKALEQENKPLLMPFYEFIHKYEKQMSGSDHKYLACFIEQDRIGWLGPDTEEGIKQRVAMYVAGDAFIDIYRCKHAEERFEIRI